MPDHQGFSLDARLSPTPAAFAIGDGEVPHRMSAASPTSIATAMPTPGKARAEAWAARRLAQALSCGSSFACKWFASWTWMNGKIESWVRLALCYVRHEEKPTVTGDPRFPRHLVPAVCVIVQILNAIANCGPCGMPCTVLA
jgi:hypothetical protein